MASNAVKDLRAGFTTVQSVGAESEKDLRDAIDRGDIPGPKILTSLQPITDAKLTPDEIRATVRKLKSEGADVIKIFASTGLGSGGKPTLTQEQLDAACGVELHAAKRRRSDCARSFTRSAARSA